MIVLVHSMNNGYTEAHLANERDNAVEHICDELDPVTKRVSVDASEIIKRKLTPEWRRRRARWTKGRPRKEQRDHDPRKT